MPPTFHGRQLHFLIDEGRIIVDPLIVIQLTDHASRLGLASPLWITPRAAALRRLPPLRFLSAPLNLWAGGYGETFCLLPSRVDALRMCGNMTADAAAAVGGGGGVGMNATAASSSSLATTGAALADDESDDFLDMISGSGGGGGGGGGSENESNNGSSSSRNGGVTVSSPSVDLRGFNTHLHRHLAQPPPPRSYRPLILSALSSPIDGGGGGGGGGSDTGELSRAWRPCPPGLETFFARHTPGSSNGSSPYYNKKEYSHPHNSRHCFSPVTETYWISEYILRAEMQRSGEAAATEEEETAMPPSCSSSSSFTNSHHSNTNPNNNINHLSFPLQSLVRATVTTPYVYRTLVNVDQFLYSKDLAELVAEQYEAFHRNFS